MATEPGLFQAFYAGPVQHPILLWLAAALCTAWALVRPGLDPALRRYCAALGALSLLDAWLTSDESFGLGRLEGGLASAVPLAFVLAGDLRYWLLVTSADAGGRLRLDARGLVAAAGLTAIVPLVSQLAMAILPASPDGARVLYLVYELAFAALVLALLALHPRLREIRWLRRLSGFVVLYYGLWAAADVWILAGSDLGFALRVIPNLLYYGGFIAAIAAAAPPVASHAARDGT